MFDSNQYARLTVLTELIEKERDHEKFEQLIAELNALIDEEKKPVAKSPSG
jgi:DNA-binding SARP family transcriptional activator